jgi:hypothetical protein
MDGETHVCATPPLRHSRKPEFHNVHAVINSQTGPSQRLGGVTPLLMRKQRRHRRGWRRKPRRLGALEYMLLALIVVCVAITVAIAVLNPGG